MKFDKLFLTGVLSASLFAVACGDSDKKDEAKPADMPVHTESTTETTKVETPVSGEVKETTVHETAKVEEHPTLPTVETPVVEHTVETHEAPKTDALVIDPNAPKNES